MKIRAFALALALVLAVPAASALATPAPAARHCPAPFTGVSDGRVSLVMFADRHGATISQVLIWTYQCTPGWPSALQDYLNRGSSQAAMPKGIRLYAFLS